VIHAYLGYNIISIEKQLMGTASLIKNISGESISVTDFRHCSNKATLHSGSNDVNCISEDVHNSLHE
jgi:hypothetical protein